MVQIEGAVLPPPTGNDLLDVLRELDRLRTLAQAAANVATAVLGDEPGALNKVECLVALLLACGYSKREPTTSEWDAERDAGSPS